LIVLVLVILLYTSVSILLLVLLYFNRFCVPILFAVGIMTLTIALRITLVFISAAITVIVVTIIMFGRLMTAHRNLGVIRGLKKQSGRCILHYGTGCVMLGRNLMYMCMIRILYVTLI